MRFLLLSSFLFLLYCCKHAEKLGKISQAELRAITIFTDTTAPYLYKSKIDLYGHYLSGIMMIKPVGSNDYKVAVTTEFGAKILDFELTNGQFILHDCIPDMKRKRVLSMIEADMKLLFAQQNGSVSVDSSAIGKPGGATPVVTITHGSDRYIYRPSPKLPYLPDTIQSFSKSSKQVEMVLSEYSGHAPQKIVVEHFNMPVRIELAALTKTTEDAE